MSKHYVPIRFRCVTEGQVGQIQALFHDKGWKATKLAERYGICLASVYRIINAVPAHLVTIRKPSRKRLRKVA